MKKVCADNVTTPGFDVSHYQSVNIHAHMAAAGMKFCLIKATEGTHIIDHMFAAHWRAAKAAGMIVGAYNFFHPSQDPQAQAERFESVVGKLEPMDLGPVIDWERTDGLSAMKDRESGYQFLQDVHYWSGKMPIIYGSPYFLKDLSLDMRFQGYSLWISHYGPKCPLVPKPWDSWNLWQYTDAGGIDLNLFNGDIEQLRRFTGGGN